MAWADDRLGTSVAEVEFDAFREIFRSPSVVHGVVAEGFGEGFADGFGFVGERDFDSFDKDVGVSAAEAWSRTGSGFGVWGRLDQRDVARTFWVSSSSAERTRRGTGKRGQQRCGVWVEFRSGSGTNFLGKVGGGRF